jgi:hypothetical protein
LPLYEGVVNRVTSVVADSDKIEVSKRRRVGMDKITVGFALECAKDMNLWKKYFGNKSFIDVLMSAKNIDVDTLCRAGVPQEKAVELMAQRQDGHIGCHGRRTIFANAKGRSTSLVEKPKVTRTKVIIRKKSGEVYGRQVVNTKNGSKTIAWNGYAK